MTKAQTRKSTEAAPKPDEAEKPAAEQEQPATGDAPAGGDDQSAGGDQGSGDSSSSYAGDQTDQTEESKEPPVSTGGGEDFEDAPEQRTFEGPAGTVRSTEDVARGLPVLEEAPKQTLAPEPNDDPLHDGLTNTSFADAETLSPDHSVDDLIADKGDEWVTLAKDVVQEFYFPDTKRPSYKLLYRKGQVVKRSELEAEVAAQKARAEQSDTSEQSGS